MRVVLRLTHADGNVQAAVNGVLTYLSSCESIPVANALGSLLLRRVTQLSSRSVNAAEVALSILQHAKRRWGGASPLSAAPEKILPDGLVLLVLQAEEVIAKARAALVAQLRPLLDHHGEWNRTQIAAIVQAAPCLADMNPQRYVSSVETRAARDDITTDLLTISCRDPLSLLPITVPVRGRNCTHIQPFDLDAFLQAAERAARFVNTDPSAGPRTEVTALRCPVCSQPVSIEDLYVDRFLREQMVRLAAARPQRISLCAETGAVAIVAAEDRGAGEDSRRPPASPGANKTPPPQKRPREIEVEGRVLAFDEDE